MREYVPRFSDQEYERRYKLIREGMSKQGIDCLLVPSNENFVYLTNITTMLFSVYMLFPHEGEPTVFADIVMYRELDSLRNGPPVFSRYWGGEGTAALDQSSVVKDMRGVLPPDFIPELVKWIRDRGYEHGTIGVPGREVEWTMGGGGLVGVTGPMSLKIPFYNALTAALPDATFVDATQIFRNVRVIKSAEEIESIKKGCRIADLCAEAMAEEMKRPGCKEGDLFAAFWNTLYRNGGGFAWIFGCCSNPTSKPSGHTMHMYPYDYTLQEGDIVICELIPEYMDGYAAHNDFCCVLGEPARPAIYEKVNEVCLATYSAVVDCLRPGTIGEEIFARGEKPIEKAGFRRSAPLCYSLGLYGMEPPFFGLPMQDPYWSEQTPLQAGMIVNVISHVYDNDESNACVRTGSTHLITDTGNIRLNNCKLPRGMVRIKR